MKSTSDLKKQNTEDILKTIHFASSISKNEIAEKLRLSPSTVHNIITELTEDGVCVHSGESLSRGGRNAALYQINANHGLIIGQILFRKYLYTTVHDLSLTLKHRSIVSCDISEPRRTIATICEQTLSMIEKYRGQRILGVGISLPGRSDKEGVVQHIPGYLNWRKIPIREIVEANTNLPVYVDNDCNTLVLSSQLNGLCTRYKNVVYVRIGEGVGIGTIFDGKLFYGSYGQSCEIGHTTIDYNGALCACGNRGCLQTFVEYETLIKKFNEQLAEAQLPPVANIEQAMALAEDARDPAFLQIFRDATGFIAITVMHIARLYGPEAIIVQCDWLNRFPTLFSDMRDQIFDSCDWIRQDQLQILRDEDSNILTASSASLFLTRYYEDYHSISTRPPVAFHITKEGPA